MSHLFKILCLLFHLLFFFHFAAQACDWKFRVTDEMGQAVSQAHIRIETLQAEGFTSQQGTLLLPGHQEGHYTLQVIAKHYRRRTLSLHLDCATDTTYTIMLEPERQELETVEVNSQSANQVARASAFSMEAIDMKAQYSRSSDMNSLLNRATGLRLRSDGYLGAPVNINLGGLQGKAVRLFRDGIPLEIFGHGYDPSLISANMLERVEIYKGAMPVALGADALGGGINFVSRRLYHSSLEATYEIGSFGTHQLGLNAGYSNDSSRFFAGISMALNTSKNNYTITAPMLDPVTAQQVPTAVKRFHDATRSFYAEGFAGWRRLSWADELRLTLIGSGLSKAVQNDVQMNKVYGQARGSDIGITPMLHWQKGFLGNRLNIRTTFAYSSFATRFTDTATIRYNWDGRVIAANMPPGEINNGSLQRLQFRFYTARVYAAYQLHALHSLELSSTLTARTRTGSDPYGARTATAGQQDILTIPAHYYKSATGLGLRSLLLQGKIENHIALKYYTMEARGYSSDNFGFTKQGSTATNNPGLTEALSYRVNSHWLLKASYEYATRQPDESELFGDGIMIRDNLSLQPEKSHNINAGAWFRSGNETGDKISAAVNLFYRRVQDLILLQADIPYNRYINYDNARIKGVELELQYNPLPWLSLGGNATYQDIRRVDIREPSLRFLNDSRVNNIPFLFGNLNIAFSFNHLLLRNSRLEVLYYCNYVHRFFLLPVSRQQEPSLFGAIAPGYSNLVIPNDGRTAQVAQDAGLVYHLPQDKISIAFECTNIGNTRLFDNFKVQRPGRAFHLKVKYLLR